MADKEPEPAAASTRHPLTGSCHCGATRYVVFLNFPHVVQIKKGMQQMYRCNCTVCHKSGIFHIRPISPPDDFLLLTPLDPLEALADYQCGDKNLHFYFCRTCGGRCFTFAGEGELVDVDLAELGVPGYDAAAGDGKVKAWRPKKDGWTDDGPYAARYLSVNGQSIDQKQAVFDMREIMESKNLVYLNMLKYGEEEGYEPLTVERPYSGGAY